MVIYRYLYDIVDKCQSRSFSWILLKGDVVLAGGQTHIPSLYWAPRNTSAPSECWCREMALCACSKVPLSPQPFQNQPKRLEIPNKAVLSELRKTANRNKSCSSLVLQYVVFFLSLSWILPHTSKEVTWVLLHLPHLWQKNLCRLNASLPQAAKTTNILPHIWWRMTVTWLQEAVFSFLPHNWQQISNWSHCTIISNNNINISYQ